MTKYKTALVTGATSGFGKEICLVLASLGIQVIACGRRADRLKELSDSNTNILGFELDVCDNNKVLKLKDELVSKKLTPDILVNNAGLALGLEPADQTNLDDWEKMIDTNIKGVTYMTRAFSPFMRANNLGYIINIGSIAGSWPYAGGNTYGATKAFVAQFSRNLRCDFAGTKIKVTCIEPGLAQTEFSVVRFDGDSQKASSVYQGTEPLTAGDIADIVKYLVSLPEHVNINTLEVMPTCQSWAAPVVTRR
jgi:3-hydroxy acid dehydrogenase/malonic semialdehyde reductase